MNQETRIEAAGLAETPAKAPNKARRIALMLVVPLLLVLGGAWMWWSGQGTVSTDNAQVKQDITSVGAQVSGPIAQVYVKEGQRVQAGQLLFRIDPEPFRVALLQAEAQLAQAQLSERQVVTQAAGTSVDITGAEAQLAINQRALARQAELLRQGFTTKVRYDEALSDVEKSRTALADAAARAANAHDSIAPGGDQPSEAAARAAIASARLNLSRTEVRAPAAGIVSNTDRLLPGQQAVPGIGLLSLVGSKSAWVEANFKEKDLAKMAPGQKVEVEIDAYPGLKLHGRVESIGAGTGSEFAILPAQNANGNWVKVSQRVPVRIAFDEKPSRPMIAGLSATVTVDVGD
ncbi:HlyD family secretion protein [Sphingomonas astaxanthinifaciens]|uniref:Membrane protein n=1 Tax=Sphingomonas astaxanthinifaciens DSM 22298 TaxID=1123267 RepID=A0ABQ5Z2I9_9SPHN|nr:HlyD family secretion protein [Sphingomonas astaxanthinifaciens]GLR46307.1 membrane protein [Sphingomonas astaxanthinifaciens DSM 22298]